jgi:hypothetical protein
VMQVLSWRRNAAALMPLKAAYIAM